jgi:Flp pilus assembly protein CpaB
MKSKFPLIIAIVIGVVALLAIRSYVNKMEQQAQDKLKGDPVVAASTDIPVGAELTMQMLAPKEVPRQFIPSQAIQGSAEVKQIIGRKTRVAVRAGQILLWSDLVSEARGGLASVIPAGEGAYTVSMSKGAKSGLIQPSDHIDVIATFAMPKPNQPLPATSTATSWRQGSDMVNVVLLQNVTVLAVGDVFAGGVRSEGAPAGDLTLSLTLPEAQLVMFAAQHGELAGVLRREGATEVKPHAELPRITFQTLEGIIGDLDGKRNTRVVEVQKGLNTDAVPVNNPKP